MKHKDKVYHFLACYVLSLYSIDVAITAALVKEYADSKAYGNSWSWGDILADVAGIIAGRLTRFLLHHFNILHYGEITSYIHSIFHITA